MDKPKDYVVYVLGGERSRPGGPAKKSTGIDYHAGENEPSNTLYTHPELVREDRAVSESGADQKRQQLPEFLSALASGGTRVSLIIIRVMAHPPHESLASGMFRVGSPPLSKPSAL